MTLVKISEATALKRRLYFYLVAASDKSTPYTSGGGLQPSISINGAAFTTTGVGTLNHMGNGNYYADVAQSAIAAVGLVTGFVTDTAIVPVPSLNMLQVVNDDPYAVKSSHSADDVWAVSTRELTSLGASAVNSIWNQLVANITTANSIGKRIKDNLDVVVSTRSDFDASTDGVNLASTGLDSIPITEFTGRATNFRQMLIGLYMRFCNKVTQTSTTQTVFLADNVTTATTSTVSEAAGTQTKGKAS